MSGEEARSRLRVCGAILRDGHILMVRHSHDGRTYWTLPGGGVETGETAPEAVLREVREETGLAAVVDRWLFTEPYAHGRCECYLLDVQGGDEPALGYDPEEADRPAEERMLQQVAWKPLSLMAEDHQVAQVLRAISA